MTLTPISQGGKRPTAREYSTRQNNESHAKRVADALPEARSRRRCDTVITAEFIVCLVYRTLSGFVNPGRGQIPGRRIARNGE